MSDISGFDELERAVKQMTEELEQGITEMLEETATECVAETQSRTNVLTGNLRRSWTHGEVETSGTEKSIKLGSALEYAQPVEEGYKRGNTFVEGKHMLKDSVTIAQKELDKKVNDLASKVFGR